jgi:hypothetical protein
VKPVKGFIYSSANHFAPMVFHDEVIEDNCSAC